LVKGAAGTFADEDELAKPSALVGSAGTLIGASGGSVDFSAGEEFPSEMDEPIGLPVGGVAAKDTRLRTRHARAPTINKRISVPPSQNVLAVPGMTDVLVVFAVGGSSIPDGEEAGEG
jgi:hypothetical protein